MFERGGWGIARSFALLSVVAAAVVGCGSGPPPLAAGASSSEAVAAPPVPTTGGAGQPLLPEFATPASLVGLSAEEVASLIGPPKWRRRESPAQVWQYQGTACILDVYLYEEEDGARVVYAEARSDSLQPVSLAACLERIEAERRASAPSS